MKIDEKWRYNGIQCGDIMGKSMMITGKQSLILTLCNRISHFFMKVLSWEPQLSILAKYYDHKSMMCIP